MAKEHFPKFEGITHLTGSDSLAGGYDMRDASFDAAYRRHIVELYQRVQRYYDRERVEIPIHGDNLYVYFDTRHRLDTVADKLLNLPADDAVFKLLPPKE
jgi:hypothetical protein